MKVGSEIMEGIVNTESCALFSGQVFYYSKGVFLDISS